MLEAKILQELRESGISQQVIDLNVKIVDDIEIDPVTNDVSAPIAEALNRRYTRFGHQAKASETAALFTQESGEVWQAKVFKINDEGNKRTGQYIAPTGIGDVPYLPSVPEGTAKNIAARHGLEAPTGSFWQWMIENPEVPVVITEGAKKALALISVGIPAISLYGCQCGKEGDFGIKESLRPWVEGREVTIAFDKDERLQTITKVYKATKWLCRALEKIATPRVAIWNPAAGKGIDDVLARNVGVGVEAIANAVSIAKFRLMGDESLVSLNPREIHAQFIKEVEIPDNERLVGIKSRKKTGKTELLSRIINEAPEGTRVLVFSHREQLVKELARRFKLEYRTELTVEGRTFGYGLCVDSAHPEANPPLIASEWQKSWLVFDECEQVFWHLLNSDTCRFKRMAIIQTLTELAQSADRIFLADADLTKVSIDYVNGMLEEPLTPYVVINKYEHLEERKLYTFKTAESLYKLIMESAHKGEKLLIHTGSQQEKSKWGTFNMESMLKGLFPTKKILRIDGITVAEPGHEAFGCIEGINEVLPLYDIVLASPTIETGISIECNHFDKVFCFATGSQTVDAIAQTIERERSNIPRYLWVGNQCGWNKIGSGATDAYSVMADNKKLTKVNAYYAQVDNLFGMEGESRQVNQQTWAKFAAHHNTGFAKYRAAVIEKVGEDFTVIEWSEDSSVEDLKMIKEIAKETAERNHIEHCEEVSSAETLTTPELQKIEKKRAKTKAERLAEKKATISKKYHTEEVSAELVDKDSDGWYREIMIQYFLTEGKPFLQGRDQERVLKLAEKTDNVFAPDMNRVCLSALVKSLERIGIVEILSHPKQHLSNETLAEWFESIKSFSNDLRRYAKVSITENTTAIQALSRILSKMGLKLKAVSRSRTKGLQRTYTIEGLNDGRNEVFTRITAWYNSKQQELIAA